jgi:hypothetical protein
MPLTDVAREILWHLRHGAATEYELYTEIGDDLLAPFAIRAELRALRRFKPPLVAEQINGRWKLTEYAATRIAQREYLQLEL